jgi:hypothetical protein
VTRAISPSLPSLTRQVIGRDRGDEATEPREDIRSRYYGSDGSTLESVYELDGDTLTIWFGQKGSPASYKAASATTAIP